MHIMLVCGRELFKDNGFKFFANFTFSPLKISPSLVMCTARLGYTAGAEEGSQFRGG